MDTRRFSAQHPPSPATRRSALLAVACGVLAAGAPSAVRATSPRAAALPAMTEGPFYPPRRWREQWTDWDADLTRVLHRPDSPLARGEHLGLEGRLVDSRGRRIDGAEVEIWQCDAMATYHHPGVRMEAGRFDPGFAGFGSTRSDADGAFRLRTIRPTPYPGRTPHIHVKLRHPSFGEVTSQLFVAGDPGNDRDFLWRQLDPAGRAAATLELKPADAGSGLRWMARPMLVIGT